MESDADLVAATAGGTILGKCLFEENFVISRVLHIFASQSRVFLSQT